MDIAATNSFPTGVGNGCRIARPAANASGRAVTPGTQAPLRYSALSEKPSSHATAWTSPDRHLLRLAFELHGSRGSTRGLIHQEGCEGIPVCHPSGGDESGSLPVPRNRSACNFGRCLDGRSDKCRSALNCSRYRQAIARAGLRRQGRRQEAEPAKTCWTPSRQARMLNWSETLAQGVRFSTNRNHHVASSCNPRAKTASSTSSGGIVKLSGLRPAIPNALSAVFFGVAARCLRLVKYGPE